MENRAAHRAIRASWVLPPKSTILLMVEATELLMWVMMSTPRKLNTALVRMAARTLMHRVAMQVAMALGASVQPFTSSTPRVRSTDRARAGFSTAWAKNVEKEAGMRTHLMPTV